MGLSPQDEPLRPGIANLGMLRFKTAKNDVLEVVPCISGRCTCAAKNSEFLAVLTVRNAKNFALPELQETLEGAWIPGFFAVLTEFFASESP